MLRNSKILFQKFTTSPAPRGCCIRGVKTMSLGTAVSRVFSTMCVSNVRISGGAKTLSSTAKGHIYGTLRPVPLHFITLLQETADTVTEAWPHLSTLESAHYSGCPWFSEMVKSVFQLWTITIVRFWPLNYKTGHPTPPTNETIWKTTLSQPKAVLLQ